MSSLCHALLLGLLLAAVAPPAAAVSDGYDPPAVPPPTDPDAAAGLKAFQDEDWQGVIDNLGRLVERRPWDDKAHNLLGFAYRKLGDYHRALAHYGTALDLNPHHRGAMEYLGEAYLELDRPAQASELLERLAAECRRVNGDDWQADCAEWQELKAAIDAYRPER